MKRFRFIATLAALVLLLSVLQPALMATDAAAIDLDNEFWYEWDVIRPATCSQTGLRIRYSSHGRSQRQTIPKTAHKYGAWTIISEATCTQRAREAHRCTVCGGGYEWQWTGDLAPHTWGEWAVVREALPGEPGLRRRECAVCGTAEEEEFSGDFQVSPAKNEENPYSVALEVKLLNSGDVPYHLKDIMVIEATARNIGSAPFTEMTIEPSFSVEEGGVHYDGPIAPGESRSATFQYEVTQEDVDQENIHLTVSTFAWGENEENSAEPVASAGPLGFDLPASSDEASYKLELVAYNIDSLQEPYGVDDVIHIQATATNRGTESLDEIIIYDPYGMPAGHATYTVLPGESYTKTFEYTVTQEDIDNGGITFDIQAVGWDTKPAEPVDVWAAPVSFDLAVLLDPQYSPSLELDYVSDAYSQFKLGAPIYLELALANTGNQQLTIDELNVAPADKSYLDVNTDFDNIAGTLIDPDDVRFFDYTIVISQEDVDSGKAVRDFTVTYQWIQEGGTEHTFATNTYHAEYLIDSSKPYPELTLTCGEVTVEGAYPGAAVKAQMTLTNTGNVDIEFRGIDIGAYEGMDEAIAYDSYDVWSSELMTVLEPEQSLSVTHTTKIVTADLAKKYVGRGLTAYGVALLGEEDNAEGESADVYSNWESIYADLVPDTAESVTIVKSRVGDPANGVGYQVGEPIHYHVEITNNNDAEIIEPVLFDPIFKEDEIPLVDKRPSLAPSETWIVEFDYTVTDADMIGPTLYNQAECLYDLDGETYSVKSNIVEAPLDQPLEEPIIDLHEHYDFKPANGSYYTPGEKVEIIIDISNPNSVPLKDVKVYNPLYWSGESGTVVKHYETMDPYFSDTMGFVYEIQGPDADQGTIYNTSTADGYFGNDFLHAASEPVTIPTGYPNPEKRIPFGLSISKVETSKPTHDGKYWIDEVITYDITVTNTGSYPLFNVTVKDSLKMEDGGVLGVISTFGPSESKTYSFSHKVTKADEIHEKVYNYAIADYSIDPPMLDTIMTNPVISLIGKKPGGTEPDPGLPEDACVRTLISKGPDKAEYTLSLCETHEELLAKADALIAAAATDEDRLAAYTEANALWNEAIEALYQELVNAYPESGSAVIASNSAWRQSIAAYADVLTQAHGLSALEAAKKINGVLVTRTVDLCYALHEAGESKLPESMITGKYHNLAGSTKSLSSAAQLTRTAGGRLRLTVTLSSDHAVIEKMLNKSLTASETAENKAAMLAVATSSYRTMISGMIARAAKSGTEEATKALRQYQTAALALLDQDAALWTALWPDDPVAAAEITCRETRETAVSFSGPAK